MAEPQVPITPTALQAGLTALQAGAWEEACAHLQASVAAGETAEALEHLGLAAWWLDDAPLTFDARERSYRLYRDLGDARGAARVALWLVWDYLAFRGDTAVASGWLERARRLLTGHEESAEYGWLLLREGEVALFRGHDPASARECGVRAAHLGRALGDRGIEFTGLALEGLALVSAGDIPGGMRCLDEATAAATAGEVKELHTVGVVCCWQIFACERVRDYDRAAQWCARVQEFSKRWRVRVLSAICRTQYAGVLIWRGEWADAEAELMLASRELEQVRPAMAVQALARLGQLRLQQGRLDEADRLFEQAISQPLARLGRAALLLEHGKAGEAGAEVDRFLSTVPAEPTIRAAALELGVRIQLARGDLPAAEQALEELQQIALRLQTAPLAASAAAAEGGVRRQGGDLVAATVCFENAVHLYQESGAPFETARAKLDLSGTLAATGRYAPADREARQASEIFHGLGAQQDEARARALLERPTLKRKGDGPAGMTARQLEILRLVAQGMSNPQIATRLRLSDHTVKRHVANLLTKLGLPSRAAAVAYAAREGLL
ncbi:MAG: helix-turn-helix transcriptional regulator [Gemmatimonadetes bacterium]|nr:helix-turn-helix transcriptional regulator [Gemmatimonadota bacterium]